MDMKKKIFPEHVLKTCISDIQTSLKLVEMSIITIQTIKTGKMHYSINKLSTIPMSLYQLKHFDGLKKLSNLEMQEQIESMIENHRNTEYFLRKDIEGLLNNIDNVLYSFEKFFKVTENIPFHKEIKSSIERLKDSSNYFITFKKKLKDIKKLYEDILDNWVDHELVITKYMIKNPEKIVVKSGPLTFTSPQEALKPIEQDYIVDIKSMTSADKEKYYRFEKSIDAKVNKLERKINHLVTDLNKHPD